MFMYYLYVKRGNNSVMICESSYGNHTIKSYEDIGVHNFATDRTKTISERLWGRGLETCI